MRKRLEDYPDEFKPCRERRHHWTEKGIYRHRDGAVHIVFVYECDSCGAERQSWYTRQGEFVLNRIYYPRGYLFKLTDKEREVGFRFTQRAVMGFRVRNAKGLDDLPER